MKLPLQPDGVTVTAQTDYEGNIIHLHGFHFLLLEVGTHGPFKCHDLVISKQLPTFPLLLAPPELFPF